MKNVIAMLFLISCSVLAYAEPSFDCAKASTAVEITVCSDKYLGDLDGLLAQDYKNAPWSEWDENGKKAFKAEQKTWMIKRDACADNACLISAYKSRIDEICEIPVMSGVNNCRPWEELDSGSGSSQQAQQPVQQQAAEPPYKLEWKPAGAMTFIQAVSLTGKLTIKDIVVNEGNCPDVATRKALPKSIKMGEAAGTYIIATCNIVKIDVVTDQGTWTHTIR